MRLTSAPAISISLWLLAQTVTASWAAESTPSAQGVIASALASFEKGDSQGAIRLLRPLASGGQREAQFLLGRMLESLRQPTQPHYAEAANWYFRAAQAGHADAMNNLAALHVDGLGVPVAHSVARHWYERAAVLGLAPAQYNLALMLGRGQGGPQDDSRMLAWLERAADAQYDRAQAQLGRLVLEGTGGKPPNAARAVQLFRLAADQGNAQGQYHLGILMQKGAGVPRDLEQAYRWLERAADQSHPLAAWELGVIYEMGLGVPSDADRSFRNYRTSAYAGHVPAIERMHDIHRNGGLGQSANPALAAFWAANLKTAVAQTATKGKTP